MIGSFLSVGLGLLRRIGKLFRRTLRAYLERRKSRREETEWLLNHKVPTSINWEKDMYTDIFICDCCKHQFGNGYKNEVPGGTFCQECLDDMRQLEIDTRHVDADKYFEEMIKEGARKEKEYVEEKICEGFNIVKWSGEPPPPLIYKEEVALKFDSDKPRMDLLSVDAQIAIAKIMTFGAKKYGDHNWRKGFNYSRLYAACQRHLTSWWNGDTLDKETKESHLHHAACCLMMLIEHEIRNLGTDDRYYKDNGAKRT
jgi:hypothetical protein